jgi:hypothetical protein
MIANESTGIHTKNASFLNTKDEEGKDRSEHADEIMQWDNDSKLKSGIALS